MSIFLIIILVVNNNILYVYRGDNSRLNCVQLNCCHGLDNRWNIYFYPGSIFTFLSKTDSPFSIIGKDTVYTVQLNSSGRAEIGMTLPDFVEEELDL